MCFCLHETVLLPKCPSTEPFLAAEMAASSHLQKQFAAEVTGVRALSARALLLVGEVMGVRGQGLPAQAPLLVGEGDGGQGARAWWQESPSTLQEEGSMGEELFLWSPLALGPGRPSQRDTPLLCSLMNSCLQLSGLQISEKEWFIVSIIRWNALAWPHAAMGQEPSLRPHPLKDAGKQGLGPVTHRQAAVPRVLSKGASLERTGGHSARGFCSP